MPAAVHYTYRNIKKIDMTEFERRLLASGIVRDPPDTPDEFVDRLERLIFWINLRPCRQVNGRMEDKVLDGFRRLYPPSD